MLIYRIRDCAATGDGLLPAADFEAWRSAQECMSTLAADGRDELERRLRAVRRAHRRARERGYQAGLAAATRASVATSARIDAAWHALDEDIAACIVDATRRIVAGAGRTELLKRQIRHALALARSRKPLTVHVAPDALERARAAIGVPDARVRIEADAAIAPDGCIVETEHGVIDAGLDAQLDALRTSVLAALDTHADDPDGTR